ncbi:hypothetical protein CCH79_00006040 [Gambusia affinis]|uniref:Uncharacterized protein n=1 Tax=Gambusia affinis TaxID=33528 RepID=A0A315VKC8_GAMAF|nr:hypothetical protein CCH79_00006040 [Gambusia affinis]
MTRHTGNSREPRLCLRYTQRCAFFSRATAGMAISASKSEAMVLSRKRVECLLRVVGVLPQVEEFKYLGILFTNEGRRERETDRRIGAASAVKRALYHSVVVKTDSKSEALDLLVNLRSHPHLWS